MTVNRFGNLAIKVGSIDDALGSYRSLGATVGERGPWFGGERVDVTLGGLDITLFTRSIYEDVVELPAECLLHMAFFTDDLDRDVAGRQLVWGPGEVEGSFGRRRIAFIDWPGGARLELMEQIEGPSLDDARQSEDAPASGSAPR